MKRQTLLSICVVLGAVLMCAASGTAHAQANACCGFSVIANQTIPAGCFNINVTTSWGAGGATQTDVVTTNGTTGFNIIGCNPAAPTTPFNWVSLDGGNTKILYNTPTTFILPCNTCVNVIVDTDPNGCIRIRLTICP